MGDATKADVFSEKLLWGGGGVIFNPKIYFDLQTGLFEHEIPKKLQHYFPKMRWGGQRPFRTFPKFNPFW